MSRKFSIGKVASRSCCAARGAEHARAEAARLVDQRGLLVAEPKGVGREDRRVAVVRVEVEWFMRRAYQAFAASA